MEGYSTPDTAMQASTAGCADQLTHEQLATIPMPACLVSALPTLAFVQMARAVQAEAISAVFPQEEQPM